MQTKQNITAKYQQIKLKSLLDNYLDEKEQGFLSFYDNNVLKYGLSGQDRDTAFKQAEILFNNLFKGQ